ncbi:MAG: hypothetical protein JW880_05800, partial [Candidatus Thermoplasmatota archaeon]|nr:hypothetical protein [Candidatus Thermoplasmatota archaeon]
MKALASRLSFLSIPLALALSIASFSACAFERADGDYWVYSMVIIVPGFGVSATGTVDYEFVSQGTITVDAADVPVNIVRVTG